MERYGVRELARQVVGKITPAETDEFDSRADAWFADSARARSRDAKGGGPLGFGMSTVIPSLVPMVLFVADHVLSAMTEMTVEEGTKRLLGRLRRAKHSQEHTQQGSGVAGTATAKSAGSAKSAKTAVAADEPTGSMPDRQAIIAAYGGDVEAVRQAALAAGEKFGADPAQVRLVADQVMAVLFPGSAERFPGPAKESVVPAEELSSDR